MSPALVTLVTSHPPPTFLRWTPCARSSDRRSHCACSNSSAATGTLFPHTKLISKTTFPPLSNSTDDRTMITDHSLTRWCGQFFHKVFPTKEIWMVTRTCRLDFRPRQVSYILCRVQFPKIKFGSYSKERAKQQFGILETVKRRKRA